ncbi:putative S-adenosyl-L-methionine-dependent methyltransferase MMAR_1595 isoform X2 [Phoenix dactylifera]|uniref:S-adenosyl-L-methionine-dependent methyltransferase MMAR_1595 isoform X2 n=1 Tax=Phoenix dactylifera TaxID=42345 RepID=A0A8B7CVZ9_PHODC|nr:putative S-adenosyl-L-methionine-dependent methyltransferase MMAR_1595 isoform X2 [Phoenix dactylifera]
MARLENLIRPPMRCGAVAKRSIFPSLPAAGFARGRKWGKAGRMTLAIAARLGREDPDLLLRAALRAASLRFQETLRPDPLFVDPYACCLLSPISGHWDMEEQPPVLTTTLSPCHYRLATKFLDDKLLSLASSMDKVRQIVLLTDGMDTRPYRLSWPQPSIIYDVSPESVFKVASQRLKGAGAKISRNCMLVHVPLESSDLQAILCEKGFKGDKPSLWVLQGLPLLTSTGLNDILFAISNLAMKGSFLIGELPLCFLGTEIGDMPAAQKYMEKLFISHGFRADAFDYGEIAKNMLLEPPSGAYKNVLFIAEQLRLSDSQMESWWMHFERMEEEGDEEGFEEL